jgi:hypothetical protein
MARSAVTSSKGFQMTTYTITLINMSINITAGIAYELGGAPLPQF